MGHHNHGFPACCIIKNFAFVQYQSYYCGGGVNGAAPVGVMRSNASDEIPSSVTFNDGETEVTIHKETDDD